MPMYTFPPTLFFVVVLKFSVSSESRLVVTQVNNARMMNEEFPGSLSLPQPNSRKRKWEMKRKMVEVTHLSKAVGQPKFTTKVFCIAGVMSTLLLYELFQEGIVTSPCGEAYIKYSSFIVLCSRMLTFVAAGLCMLIKRKIIAPVAPLYKYGAISLSNALATNCQSNTLKHVSFRVQTLGKCAKMLLVMVWDELISRKRYNIKDHLSSGLGIVGSVVFFLVIASTEPLQGETESTIWGIVFMSGYLGFDSFTSTSQDKLFKGYNMDIFNQIFYTTLCSNVLSIIWLVRQGQWLHIIDFAVRHPDCIYDVLCLSCAATASHFFVSYTIRTCGARLYAGLMTSRHLLSFDLPYLLFGHRLTAQKWGTAIAVIGASLYSTSYISSLQNNGKGSDDLEKEKLKVRRKLGDTDVGRKQPLHVHPWLSQFFAECAHCKQRHHNDALSKDPQRTSNFFLDQRADTLAAMREDELQAYRLRECYS